MLDEVQQPGVRPLEVLEHQHGRAVIRDALEEEAPGREEHVAAAGGSLLDTEQGQERWRDAFPLARVGHELGESGIHRGAGRGLVSILGQAASAAHHLAECPERDPLPVGWRAAAMPVDVLGHPVGELLQLPDQPALADAARAGDRHQPNPPVAADRMEDVLQLAQLLLAPDERRLEGIRPALAATLGHDAHRPPGRNRRGLALQRVVAERLEDDGALRRPTRGLADEHGPCLRDALEARRGVDEVAGHHALVRRVQRDRRLAGQDAGSSLEVGVQRLDCVDELQPCADRALGVVLVGDRRAPHGHDRVADELLDDPAVHLHDPRRGVEIVLRSSRTASGSRSSAIVVKPTRSVKRTVTRRRSASAVGAGVRSGPGCRIGRESVWPQLAQKRASLRFGSPQFEQATARPAPQLSQNLLPARFSVPHAAQITPGEYSMATTTPSELAWRLQMNRAVTRRG